jgi:hypothetical protein
MPVSSEGWDCSLEWVRLSGLVTWRKVDIGEPGPLTRANTILVIGQSEVVSSMDEFKTEIEGRQFKIARCSASDPSAEVLERQVLDRGVAVPLPHRLEWANTFSPSSSFFCVSSRDRGPECTFLIESDPSRILPGHRTLRLERFGNGLDVSVLRAAMFGLYEHVLRADRVLRVHIDLFGKNVEARTETGAYLASLGFRPVADMRNYANTIDIALLPDPEDLFRSLKSTAKKNLKSIRNKPVVVAPILEECFAPRLNELLDEVMSRTGGAYDDTDWSQLIVFARNNPSLVRIVGLFHEHSKGPDSMLAFAIGRLHGDHVEYSTAAATRNTELRAPLAYAPVWAILEWGHERNADWFDFGGVTAGTAKDSWDKLGGISDFKRFFSKNVISIGEEWVLDVSDVRAKFADFVGGGIRKVRSAGQRFGK